MIKYKNIVLRNSKETDYDDYHNWFFVDKEWGEWDAPWEEDWTEEQYQELIEDLKENWYCKEGIWYRFEIEAETKAGVSEHIGWVSSYNMDNGIVGRAIGINIPPQDARGKGYGKNAYIAFINYLFEKTKAEVLYTQTWSGNYPMIAMARSVGFKEIERIKDLREWKNIKYDALTFAIYRKDIERR